MELPVEHLVLWMKFAASEQLRHTQIPYLQMWKAVNIMVPCVSVWAMRRPNTRTLAEQQWEVKYERSCGSNYWAGSSVCNNYICTFGRRPVVLNMPPVCLLIICVLSAMALSTGSTSSSGVRSLTRPCDSTLGPLRWFIARAHTKPFSGVPLVSLEREVLLL